jgi:hypothetical protein
MCKTCKYARQIKNIVFLQKKNIFEEIFAKQKEFGFHRGNFRENGRSSRKRNGAKFREISCFREDMAYLFQPSILFKGYMNEKFGNVPHTQVFVSLH